MKIKKDRPVPDREYERMRDNPFDYLTSLKTTGRAAIHDDLENMNKAAHKQITSMDIDSEVNIAKTIRELVYSPIVIPKDMKIDDRDLPTAANFYEWVTQDRFGTIGDERPFLEQLIWGLVSFNDVCHNPKCSDLEWLYDKHKVDDSYSKLERKVSLLNHGVCPNCGKGRSYMVRKGKAPFINELAINAGQRCVIGSTPVITEQGILHIDEICRDAPLGFSEFEIPIHNGQEFETTSHFFRAAPEPVVRLTSAMGFSVTGTRDHPVMTEDGFVKLGEIAEGQKVLVKFGQRIFGSGNLSHARQMGSMFYNTQVPRTVRTANESCTLEFLRGLFQEPRRIMLGTEALRDISAMLLNAGYPHHIDGPAITISDNAFANLHGGLDYETGEVFDDIISIVCAGTQETFDFTLPETHQFLTGGILSHNSGKSHTVGTYLFPYLMHRLLKLQRPAQFYGLSRTTVLQGTFAALTYTQAKDTLWTPFYGAITQSQWFKEYHGMLRHYERVYGETLFKLTDTFVDYRVRGLQCVTGDTLVETARGIIPIRDVILGDMVRGVDGFVRVVGWHSNGRKQTYKLRTKNGFELCATDNHPILFKDGEHMHWGALGKLLPGDFVGVQPTDSAVERGVRVMLDEVESIERQEIRNVYDITLDDDSHSFFGNGIIQHNCFPMGPDKRIMRGRCTRFSTILNTSEGFLSAGELIKKNGYHKVSGLMMDSHKGRVKVSHTYKDKSETIRVETRNGYHIEGTPEHPMLVLTPDLRFKWTALDEMQEGDWIVSLTKKNNPMYGNNRAVSKDMATIMGYYVANGYRNSISSRDDVVINNLYKKYKKITGFIPTFCDRAEEAGGHDHYLELGGTGLFVRDYLRPLGIKSRNSTDKEIPRSIRTAPQEVFHEFLEAYFECDSGVNGGGENGIGSTRPHEIEVGSASRKLARQLHVILLHAYGIVGRLQKIVKYDKLDKSTGLFNAKREHWIVSITGYDAMRFLNTFKRAKVQKYRDCFSNTPAGFMSDRRNIPYVREFVYDTYENARLDDGSGKKLRTYVREDGSIYSTKKLGFARPDMIRNYRPNNRNVDISAPIAEFAVYEDENWDQVLPILEQFNSERAARIRTLLELGAHFEEVVSIKHKNRKVNVYDVTVPGIHAFTANGLVSHNTRFGFCYAGNTLVSTDTGLMRIDDTTITGRKAHAGNEVFNVTRWQRSHFAHDVIRMHLANGLWLDVTSDHKVMSESGPLKACDMLGHKAILSYSPFGNTLEIDSTIVCDNEESAVQKMIQLAHSGYASVRQGNKLTIRRATKPTDLCEVVSIEALSPQWVYDITVDSKDHMFTANGVVASNSIDEIAYFDAEKDSGKVKINAFEVYDALANSLATVRTAADTLIAQRIDDVLPAYAFNVSSPTAKNDMIHVLLDRAKESRSMYGIHRATWEVNPNFKRNSPFIVEAYRKDPESAEKNFAANPPLIANPFLSNHDFINDCEDVDRKNPIKLETRFVNSKKVGQSYMYAEVTKLKKSGVPSIMAIDAGEKDNSFSVAVGSLAEGYNLNVDLVAEIIPLPGYRLNHSLIYSEVILRIMQDRNVKVLLADRWNSLKLLSDAELDMGDPDADVPTFIAKQHSLKYVEMVGVRTCIEQGMVKIPKSEIKTTKLLEALDSDYRDFYAGKPIAHLFKQMYTVKDLQKTVGKGDGYTDDNWRAVALLLWGLQEEEYQGMLMAEPIDMQIARPNALMVSKLGAGGGGTVGSGGSGGPTMINGAPLMLMTGGRSR